MSVATKFGCCMPNCTSVPMKICREKFAPRVQPFKVTRSHCNRHRSMTSSDLERLDARSKFFPGDLRRYARTVWHRATKFSTVIRGGGACFWAVRHDGYPKGGGGQRPKFLDPSAYSNTVLYTATIVCMVIKLHERKMFTGSTTPRPVQKNCDTTCGT